MLIGRYPALLDANVLHPAFVRGALLWFADEGMFQPRWSADVMREWRKSVQARFPDRTDEWLDAKQTEMAAAFPGAEIEHYQSLVEAIELPDADDRHIVAAAIAGKCSGIVTANMKHFPVAELAKFELEVIHPDDFIVNIIDLDPERAMAACRRHRETLKDPPHSGAEFLERYKKTGLIQAHGRLREREDLL